MAELQYEHPCVIYTANVRCAGTLRSPHRLLFDHLNREAAGTLRLAQATISPLNTAAAGVSETAALTEVRRDAIVMVLPAPGGKQVAARPENARPAEWSILAWPFAIRGAYPASPAGPGEPLRGFPDNGRDPFFPLIDCEIVFTPSPLVTFFAPLVLVNRTATEITTSLLPSEPNPPHRTELGSPPPSPPSDLGPPQPPVAAPDQPARGGGERGVLAALEGRTDEEIAATDVDDVFEMLDQVGILQDVPLSGLRRTFQELRLAGGLEWARFERGQVVFRQGDPADRVYFVAVGEFDVIVQSSPELASIVAVLGPGEILGEMAVMGDSTRRATVRARSSAYALAVTEPGLRHLLLRHPPLTTRLLQVISERLRQTDSPSR